MADDSGDGVVAATGRGGRRRRSGLGGTAVACFKGLTGAGQRVALTVDEALDFESKLDIATAVEALAGSALVGLELGKLCFPKTQDVGFEAADTGYISDFEVEAVGNGGRVDSVFFGDLQSHISPQEGAFVSPKRRSHRSIGHGLHGW
jgi:hypothetical protein